MGRHEPVSNEIKSLIHFLFNEIMIKPQQKSKSKSMVSDMRFTVNFDIKKLYSDNYMKSSELMYLDMTLIRFENVNLIKNVITKI